MDSSRQKHYRFSIQVSPEQFRRYYEGTACTVQVYSECGRRLRFPASRLRTFLTHSGINGRFQLTVNAGNRFVDLKKIS